MIIYKGTSQTTGLSYIGRTISELKVRIRKHKYCAMTLMHNSKFYKAIRELGIDDFQWEILVKTSDEETLRRYEESLIARYDTGRNGYNSVLAQCSPRS